MTSFAYRWQPTRENFRNLGNFRDLAAEPSQKNDCGVRCHSHGGHIQPCLCQACRPNIYTTGACSHPRDSVTFNWWRDTDMREIDIVVNENMHSNVTQREPF